MKKLLFLTLAFSVSIAQVVRADNDRDKQHRRQADNQRAERPAAAPARQAVRQPAQRSITRTPLQQQAQRNIAANRRSADRTTRTNPATRPAARTEAQLDGRDRSPVTTSNQGNTGERRGSVQRNSGRRDNRDFNRNSFSVARSHVVRGHHDRNWWHRHYNTTFVLFGGGYYYWWNNYWFPAYGYSPYYNNYLYSEPIYGYDNLAPGQVIENVQLALRDEGYYSGAIDGLVGPQTRAALSAYQRDHGLVITAAVDEPTLVTLGLA